MAEPTVIDVRDRAWVALGDAGRDKVSAWLAAHGIDPTQVYRTVVDEGDEATRATVTAYRYALNAAGKKFFDPATREIVLAEPITVPLTAPLPVSFPPRQPEETSP